MFEPWIGERYGRSELLGGKRILVVGESHHSAEHPANSIVPDMTRSVMRYYSSTQARGEWMRTLDNIAWALSGKSRAELAQSTHRGEFDVWQGVAFYNYIPVVLTDSARNGRPTAEHYRLAVEPFERVMADLKPDILLICGYGLFPYVIKNHWPTALDKPWDFGGDYVDVCPNPSIRAIRLIHPSTGFSHSRWHTVIAGAVGGQP